MHAYKNGNTYVAIYDDGTKIRYCNGTPRPIHPESIDVKVTNMCDLGCVYCHESSIPDGAHADLRVLLDVLSVLPPGPEIAIGGGNPLSHPDITWFLGELAQRGLVANITMNQGHLGKYHDTLVGYLADNLIHGLGVSITNRYYPSLKRILDVSNNVVCHVIAGVNPIYILDDLLGLSHKCKVLVLGYKYHGRGIDAHTPSVDATLTDWYRKLPGYLTKCQMSFDQLAIRQLAVERLLTEDAWAYMYMGDDFEYSMYIDAVQQEFAESSTSVNRTPMTVGLLEYFQTNKQTCV